MDINQTNAYIHEHIPMTVAMGAEVEFYDGREVVVSAPLEPNRNHRSQKLAQKLRLKRPG